MITDLEIRQRLPPNGLYLTRMYRWVGVVHIIQFAFKRQYATIRLFYLEVPAASIAISGPIRLARPARFEIFGIKSSGRLTGRQCSAQGAI